MVVELTMSILVFKSSTIRIISKDLGWGVTIDMMYDLAKLCIMS